MKKFEKDYERLKKEYEDFKKEMLTKSKEEIYNSFYKINFYEIIMNNFICFLEETGETKTALKVLSEKTLKELYDDFLYIEGVSISDDSKIIEFLETVAECE